MNRPYLARSKFGHLVLVAKRSAIILQNPNNEPLTGDGWSFAGTFASYVADTPENYIKWLEENGVFIPLELPVLETVNEYVGV